MPENNGTTKQPHQYLPTMRMKAGVEELRQAGLNEAAYTLEILVESVGRAKGGLGWAVREVKQSKMDAWIGSRPVGARFKQSDVVRATNVTASMACRRLGELLNDGYIVGVGREKRCMVYARQKDLA